MSPARARDTFSGDLFEVPQPDAPLAGGQNYRSEVANLVTDVIAESGLDRYDIAANMSRLTGREVSKYMLDAWSAESRAAYNIPLYMVPVLEAACETHRFTVWLADKRGARALVGKEALDAQIGKLERVKEEATKKIKEIKRLMGETE